MSNLFGSRGIALVSVIFLVGCVNTVAGDENTAVTCGDNIDNDLDGSADCFDIECQDFPNCTISTLEDCVGGADEDGDNRVDCADSDCLDGNPNNSVNEDFCAQSEICDDLEDNDGDGLADCDDPSCNGDPNCPTKIFEVCDNGTDDDQNGFVDCEDSACTAVPICNKPGVENCNNGLDDDGDTFTDCDDAECINAVNCVVPGACGDNVKNQGVEQCDGVDLAAQSCITQGFASGTLSCNADCTFNTSACAAAPNCGNGNIDATEQCDGANLAGQNCVTRGFAGGALACSAGCQFDTAACFNVENCINGIDDDNDGQADCLDSECAAAPSCVVPTHGSCVAPVTANPGVNNFSGNTIGAGNGNFSDGSTGCLVGSNQPEDVYVITVGAGVTLSASLLSNSDLGLYLRIADGIIPAQCSQPLNEVDCADDVGGGATPETISGTLNVAATLYLFVDGCELNCVPAGNSSGPYTLTLTAQ
jgi:hypothetical protein